MGKELNQQEVDLVAIRTAALQLAQVMLKHGAQAVLAGQSGGLQELAQLMDLYALIHVREPLLGLLDRLLRRSLYSAFQVTTAWKLDYELPVERAIEGVKEKQLLPLGC